MKSAIVLLVLALAAVVLARPDTYTDRYDNIDLDEILNNRRLLVPYVKCVLDQGKCSPEGKELKSHIREALENNCGKCTNAQRNGTRKVIEHLINHEEDYWNELRAKYDPQSKYVTKYETELRKSELRNPPVRHDQFNWEGAPVGSTLRRTGLLARMISTLTATVS
ncbi:Ejaculatory bulb-specific protein 3 [Eumeta japonica]|uniref:Ejaculatory bulb-specific protein 3 n=1 Tax=Eumeta variegata TaxID=151549 RepID=A0A4C1T0U9_EUMVA|nr:Ejaculatory bulb-specific protein 3 [Eumeta japonica]